MSVRVIADNAAHALFLKHMLVRTAQPNLKPVHGFKCDFSPRVTVCLASTAIEKPGMLINLDDADSAVITVVGNIAVEQIQNAVALAASTCHAADDGPLVMNCDTHLSGGSTSLLFGLSGEGRAAAVANDSLYAAHHSVWDTSGVSRLWGGVSVPAGKAATPLSKGSIVIDGVATTSGVRDNLAAGPSTIVFIDDAAAAAAGAQKLSTEEAVAQMRKVGGTEADAAAFADLLKASGASSFVVGRGAEGALVADVVGAVTVKTVKAAPKKKAQKGQQKKGRKGKQ